MSNVRIMVSTVGFLACSALTDANCQTVTITGGTINNTTIGNTTPSTGAFTQLSANQTATGSTVNVPLTTNLSSTSASTSDLVGFTASVESSGSGNAYASNPQVQFLDTSTNFGAVEEIDGDNFSNASPCRPSAPVANCIAADGLRVTGSSGHYSNGNYSSQDPMSRAIVITGDGSINQWFDGLDIVGPNVQDYNIHINDNAATSFYDQGNHATGISLAATYSGAAIQVFLGGTTTSTFTVQNSGAVNTSGPVTSGGAVSAASISSSGAVTVGSAGPPPEMVGVAASSNAASFQLTPNGAPLAAGNTIGDISVTEAITGYVNCTDHSDSITWQITGNYVNATLLGSRITSLAAEGVPTGYWSIALGNVGGSNFYSPTITVSNSYGGTLFCTGLITVLRQT